MGADPALAARVLQIVNSAFFRLARRITKIEQAVSYLGFTVIRNIAMSVEVFSQWPSDASGHLKQVPADSRIDESYLISVKAPFDWSEAQRRVAETIESEEVSP